MDDNKVVYTLNAFGIIYTLKNGETLELGDKVIFDEEEGEIIYLNETCQYCIECKEIRHFFYQGIEEEHTIEKITK